MPLSVNALGTGVGGIVLLIIILVASKRMIGGLSIEKEDVGVPVSALQGMGVSTPQLSTGAQVEAGNGTFDINYVSRLAEQDPNSVAAWITSATRNR